MEKNLSFPCGSIKNVRVKLTFTQIEVITGTTDAFQIHIAGLEESVDDINVEVKNDELTIVQPQYTVVQDIIPVKRWMQMSLRIPDGWNGDIDISTVTGMLNARKVSVDEIAFTTVSGPIHLQQITGGHIGIRSVTGAVNGDIISAKHLYIRTMSGKVSLHNVKTSVGKVFSVSADVNISITGDARSLDTQSVSGDINVEVDKPIKNASLHSLTGQIIQSEELQKGDDGIDISSSSISGSLSIKVKK